MGMDVFGNSGAYFRRNVWGWQPLAELVCKLEPKLTRNCKHWHSNDGDGLDGKQSKALAQSLKGMLASGLIAKIIEGRDEALAALPNEPCQHCDGTGIRRDEIGTDDGQPQRIIGPDTQSDENHPRYGQTGWCNGCDGRGWKRPTATWYPLTVEDVREFAEFLDDCDGFEIC